MVRGVLVVATPTIPILIPATTTRTSGTMLLQAGGAPRGRVDQVGVEKGKGRLGGARAQGAARIVGRFLGGDRGASGAEVELVVAERGGGVAEDIVGANDRRPFVEVGGERPLEHVARVDEEDPAAVAGARAAQVAEVAAERRQRLEPAVQIVGADERDGHPHGRRRGWGSRRRPPATGRHGCRGGRGHRGYQGRR